MSLGSTTTLGDLHQHLCAQARGRGHSWIPSSPRGSIRLTYGSLYPSCCFYFKNLCNINLLAVIGVLSCLPLFSVDDRQGPCNVTGQQYRHSRVTTMGLNACKLSQWSLTAAAPMPFSSQPVLIPAKARKHDSPVRTGAKECADYFGLFCVVCHSLVSPIHLQTHVTPVGIFFYLTTLYVPH